MQSPLLESEQSRLESLRALHILDTPVERLFSDLACLAGFICDSPIAVIAFIDEQRVWFKAKTNLALDEIQRDGSFCSLAILQSDVLVVLDPFSDERFASNLQVTHLGIRFYAGIPLTVNGHAVGTLAVMDQVPHFLTAEQIDSLQILARRIVNELELRRTREVQSPRQRLHLAPSRQPSASILLVEDNDNLRNLLQRTLEGMGFSFLLPPMAQRHSAFASSTMAQ